MHTFIVSGAADGDRNSNSEKCLSVIEDEQFAKCINGTFNVLCFYLAFALLFLVIVQFLRGLCRRAVHHHRHYTVTSYGSTKLILCTMHTHMLYTLCGSNA